MLFCSLALGGEQFSFSAKTVTKNHTMHYDEINISPLMVYKKDGSPICKTKHKKANTVNTLNYIRKHES